jgi:hypothetical protein
MRRQAQTRNLDATLRDPGSRIARPGMPQLCYFLTPVISGPARSAGYAIQRLLKTLT